MAPSKTTKAPKTTKQLPPGCPLREDPPEEATKVPETEKPEAMATTPNGLAEELVKVIAALGEGKSGGVVGPVGGAGTKAPTVVAGLGGTGILGLLLWLVSMVGDFKTQVLTSLNSVETRMVRVEEDIKAVRTETVQRTEFQAQNKLYDIQFSNIKDDIRSLRLYVQGRGVVNEPSWAQESRANPGRRQDQPPRE
jgi:hypothetical protein